MSKGNTSAMPEDVAAAVRMLRKQYGRRPVIAFILGSGLGDVAHILDECHVISTEEIPGYPRSTVTGHHRRIALGTLAGKPVMFIQGRVHLYEGHPVRTVAFPVRLIAGLGIRRLVITNAAGAINPEFTTGTLMLIRDHINFGFVNPLTGPNMDGGPRFPDMSTPYDPAWTEHVHRMGQKNGIHLPYGTYLFTPGPSYETPAEIRMFNYMGADAVGMSTVPETIQAAYFGMKIVGISIITNAAAGLQSAKLSHEEVLQAGRKVRSKLELLVLEIVRELLSK